MQRPYNFSAGPAAIPEEVLRQAAAEMLDWHGSGMGVMEMSHRGKEFISIYEAAEAGFRGLLAIPPEFNDRRSVEDGVHALAGCQHGVVVADVALDGFQVGVLDLAGNDVEAFYLVAVIEHGLHEVLANKAAATGDEYTAKAEGVLGSFHGLLPE